MHPALPMKNTYLIVNQTTVLVSLNHCAYHSATVATYRQFCRPFKKLKKENKRISIGDHRQENNPP